MKHLTLLTGASRGMGLSMARQLLSAGHTVLCISRTSAPDLDAHARHVGATVLQSWLRDSEAEAPWASATLINNAGVIPQIAPLSEIEAGDLARALRVGLEAPMEITATFLRATQNWKAPRKVLNISSGLGRRAMASQAAYCAAKAGMDHFTRCLALEEALKPQGAKVCSLAPGVIDTGMQEQLRAAPAEAFPDKASFVGLKTGGSLTSPDDAAARILAYLERSDFGANPVADVRD
jgi:NAD(P)-dependent dehydrogenase (short-subunit alcohol dehydrogenase family)